MWRSRWTPWKRQDHNLGRGLVLPATQSTTFNVAYIFQYFPADELVITSRMSYFQEGETDVGGSQERSEICIWVANSRRNDFEKRELKKHSKLIIRAAIPIAKTSEQQIRSPRHLRSGPRELLIRGLTQETIANCKRSRKAIETEKKDTSRSYTAGALIVIFLDRQAEDFICF
jgi:hypothetical protein